MKYLKIYEEFEVEELELEVPEEEMELTDTTIDDVLGGDFFDDFEGDDEGSYVDPKGIIHIKNWDVY